MTAAEAKQHRRGARRDDALLVPRLHHHIDGLAEARAVLRNELFRQRRRILPGHCDGRVQAQILHAGQVAERPHNRDFRRPCARKHNQTQLPPVQAHRRGGFQRSERVGQRSAGRGKCLISAVLLVCRDAHADGVVVDVNSLVSMNMWGLTPDFLDVLEEGFKEFFEKEVAKNPLKAEYLIPTFIGELLDAGKMSVKVLRSNDTWYGMTYHEDVASVKDSFKKMLEKGLYKADLFSDL